MQDMSVSQTNAWMNGERRNSVTIRPKQHTQYLFYLYTNY